MCFTLGPFSTSVKKLGEHKKPASIITTSTVKLHKIRLGRLNHVRPTSNTITIKAHHLAIFLLRSNPPMPHSKKMTPCRFLLPRRRRGWTERPLLSATGGGYTHPPPIRTSYSTTQPKRSSQYPSIHRKSGRLAGSSTHPSPANARLARNRKECYHPNPAWHPHTKEHGSRVMAYGYLVGQSVMDTIVAI